MKHTYENLKGKKVIEILPHGRYLKVGEIVESGDLRVWDNAKHNVISPTSYSWRIGTKINSDYRRSFYRPTKPKYRILKSNEIIRKGDQAYCPLTRGWGRCVGSIGYNVGKYTSLSICSRVRRPIKP
jgi:hypothetical protein